MCSLSKCVWRVGETGVLWMDLYKSCSMHALGERDDLSQWEVVYEGMETKSRNGSFETNYGISI